MLNLINSPVYTPEAYHGTHFKTDFFEGWYIKIVCDALQEAGTNTIAVVPGIFRGRKNAPENSHAFIFVNFGGVKQHYYRFPVEKFVASDKEFSVSLDGNTFTSSGMTLDLKPKKGDDATLVITGTVSFDNLVCWPTSKLSPGVMGPFGLLPILECYHGVVSMNHSVDGSLTINGKTIVIQDGTGYIEKDWGRNFPSTWFWIQSNSFAESPGTSVFFSLARVPFHGLKFPGFIVGFWHKGILHEFTKYNFSKFDHVTVDDGGVSISLRNKTYRISVKVATSNLEYATLYAPFDGKMIPAVKEALNAEINVEFTNLKSGEVEFSGVGKNGGFEMHGDYQWLCDNV